MSSLVLQYVVFVFFAAIGTIQVSAAYAGLHGLLIFRGRRLATLLGYIIIIVAFLWFFGLVDRNKRGLEGFEQARLFAPSALCAMTVTAVITSLIHKWRGIHHPGVHKSVWNALQIPQGLEALRDMSYLDVVLDSILRKSEKTSR